MSKMSQTSKVWYKEPWPWFLMVGPAIVVVAGIATYYLAQKHNSDLVTDDYYKDGQYISMVLERDHAALNRNILVEVLINPDSDAAKVFVSGNFDPKQPLNLLFIHPAKQALDQKVRLLQAADGKLSGGKAEYNAVFKPLPNAQHWYVRVEDEANTWRVEDKWIVSQGGSFKLEPKKKLALPAAASHP